MMARPAQQLMCYAYDCSNPATCTVEIVYTYGQKRMKPVRRHYCDMHRRKIAEPLARSSEVDVTITSPARR